MNTQQHLHKQINEILEEIRESYNLQEELGIDQISLNDVILSGEKGQPDKIVFNVGVFDRQQYDWEETISAFDVFMHNKNDWGFTTHWGYKIIEI